MMVGSTFPKEVSGYSQVPNIEVSMDVVEKQKEKQRHALYKKRKWINTGDKHWTGISMVNFLQKNRKSATYI
ncbi:MAG: hypothetical protein JKX98_08995 [Alcanivoracaceae bacterium]|nr:hypothetical protein [Alcanivoracaceae bacterium]